VDLQIKLKNFLTWQVWEEPGMQFHEKLSKVSFDISEKLKLTAEFVVK
jgi:hypothetical protein